MRRAAAILLPLALAAAACSRTPAGPREVVVYVSEDQVFSQPVLERFERETGIHVRAVYDTEEAKSTGVMNRLLAERDHPQADVYWANEPIRAELLRQRGVAEPYRSPAAEGIPAAFRDPGGAWTGFSARLRVLIVSDSLEDPPRSVLDLADPRWRGRAVLANPLFGTTTAHVAALFVAMGEEAARDFLQRVRANGVTITTSNGDSADRVASGEAAFSLVDSDDAIARIRRGAPVTMVIPDQEPDGLGCLVVPNAVVLIHGGPHPEAARRLADFLLSPATERQLAAEDCAQIPLHAGVPVPGDVPTLDGIRTMDVAWSDVARTMATIQPWLQTWAGP